MAIVEAWWRVLTEKDVLYVFGDLGGPPTGTEHVRSLLAKSPASVRWVKGNHDRDSWPDALEPLATDHGDRVESKLTSRIPGTIIQCFWCSITTPWQAGIGSITELSSSMATCAAASTVTEFGNSMLGLKAWGRARAHALPDRLSFGVGQGREFRPGAPPTAILDGWAGFWPGRERIHL